MRLQALVLSTLLALAVAPSTARADGTTGWLLEKCSAFERDAEITPYSIRYSKLESALCYGYFSGIHSVAFLRDESNHPVLGFCAPIETKADRFISIFIAYARSHSEDGDRPAVTAIWSSLAAAFPCGHS